MRKIIKGVLTVVIALMGLIGGTIWAVQSNWEWEPIILLVVSFLEVVGFIILKSGKESSFKEEGNFVTQSVNVNVGSLEGKSLDDQKNTTSENTNLRRESIIELMKPRTQILFIDDDKNFNVVRILKDSGWKKTKTIIDIKSIDMPIIKEVDIFFVDINGVGKQLNLQYEGLDLALMLKQRYPTKKVVIYSANKNSNSFHRAWDECDFKLEKNALPYQFQSLVEEFSIEIYNSSK